MKYKVGDVVVYKHKARSIDSKEESDILHIGIIIRLVTETYKDGTTEYYNLSTTIGPVYENNIVTKLLTEENK